MTIRKGRTQPWRSSSAGRDLDLRELDTRSVVKMILKMPG
jgi:hypothetical protein